MNFIANYSSCRYCSLIIAWINNIHNEGQSLELLNYAVNSAVSRESELCAGADEFFEVLEIL